jgi:hypothetical protein
MTAQAHEKLILDGEETSMAFCPPLPESHPRVVDRTDEHMTPQDSFLIGVTACWRGYVAKWELRNGRFYLLEIRGKYEVTGEEPLFADWFSGVLRIPRGQLLQYVHMGFASVYEEELHIKIERGMAVKSRVIDNRDKKWDPWELGWQNMPGHENRFPGDEDF